MLALLLAGLLGACSGSEAVIVYQSVDCWPICEGLPELAAVGIEDAAYWQDEAGADWCLCDLADGDQVAVAVELL